MSPVFMSEVYGEYLPIVNYNLTINQRTSDDSCHILSDSRITMKQEKEKYAERFADYMIEALARTGKRKADIARLADLSRTTISQIVGKKPNSTTGKLILPERETVDRIARAFGDPIAVARRAAGYAVEEAEPESHKELEGDQQEEDAARLAQMIQNWMGMSREEQNAALAFFRFVKAEHPEMLKILGPKFRAADDDIDLTELQVKKIKDTKNK